MNLRPTVAPDKWGPAPPFTEVDTLSVWCGECQYPVDAAPMRVMHTDDDIITIVGVHLVCPDCGRACSRIIRLSADDVVLGVEVKDLAPFGNPRRPRRPGQKKGRSSYVKRADRAKHRTRKRKTHAERHCRFGSSNGAAKLSEAAVAEIQALYAAGGITQKQIAVRYGVTQRLISSVIRGKHWASRTQPRAESQ